MICDFEIADYFCSEARKTFARAVSAVSEVASKAGLEKIAGDLRTAPPRERLAVLSIENTDETILL